MSSNAQTHGLKAWFRVVMGAVTIAVAAACSSETATAPAEPDVAVRADAGGNGQARKAKGLERRDEAKGQYSVSKRFTKKEGGTLEISDLKAKLFVPKGALPRDTMTITMTVLAGKIVAYEFEPHGTVFLKPLSLFIETVETKGTALFGGYFKSKSQVNAETGEVDIDEVISTSKKGNVLQLKLWHFSGYMVSTGFADDGI
jgi:hypothetical protein